MRSLVPAGDRPARGGRWRRARRLLLVAAMAYGAAFAWTGRLVGWAGEAYGKGDMRQARALLERAAWWRVRQGRVQDALAVVALSEGESARAAIHLQRARRGFFQPPAFGDQRVLASLLRQGRVEEARIYGEHRMRIHESPRLAWLLGVAESALGRLDDAERHLKAARDGGEPEAMVSEQLELLAGRRRTGRLDSVVDRRGAVVAAARPPAWTPSLVAGDLAPLLAAAIEPLPERTPGRRARLALDLGMQKAAEAALGRRRGALVVLDVATGGLRAAASFPRVAAAEGLPLSLSARYEPGSIMKMITLEAALRQGIDVNGLFPMDCPGWAEVDGLAFRDWIPHRRVGSIDEAVAVSCNLAFGRLGERVGRDALDAALRRFGFTSPEGVRWQGADFRFSSGLLLEEDLLHPRYSLWRRAVGLDSLSITPVHAALLAAGLARGSAPPAPRMVEGRWNILGEQLNGSSTAAEPVPPLPPEGAALIRRVMLSAVTSPVGTARRAAVQGISAAMKTGTSGFNPPGYDALMIGFAPADRPVVAWALIAERAGKAEWEGARIVREFLTRARPLL